MKRTYRIMALVAAVSAFGATGCDEGDTASTFEPVVQKRCNGSEIQEQGVDGTWTTIDTCVPSTVCRQFDNGKVGCVVAPDENTDPDDEISETVCVAGEKKCTSDMMAFTECSADGMALTRTECNDGMYCDAGLNTCVENTEFLNTINEKYGSSCNSGEAICEENKLVKCVGGKWSADILVCNEHEECLAEGLDGCYCNTGAAHCFGNKLAFCGENYKFDISQAMDCGSYFCSDLVKDCVDSLDFECTPDEIECTGETTYHICNSSAMWDGELECSAGRVCSNNKCVTKSTGGGNADDSREACSNPGEKTCSAKKAYVECGADGYFMDPVYCKTTEKCVEGECVSSSVSAGEYCKADSTYCQGNYLQRCSGGVWSFDRNCTAEGKTCEDGACVAKESTYTGNTCSSEGARRCDGDNYYVTCSNKEWTAPINCGAGMKCRASDGACVYDTDVTTCQNGTSVCITDNYYYTCTDGKLSNKQQCSSASEKCINGSCVKCEPYSTVCGTRNSANVLRSCRADGSGYDETTCELGCSGGACNTCRTGQTQCTTDGSFQYCHNSHWKTASECGSCSESGCVCTPGEQRCSDNGDILECTTKQLDGGKYTVWEVVSSCGAGLCTENDSVAACACTSGEKRCSGGQLLECSDGLWNVSADCAQTGLSCDPETLACVCEPGASRCSGSGKREYCENGKWVSVSCSSGKTCNDRVGSICIKPLCSRSSSDENIGLDCDGSNLVDCSNGLYTVKKTCTSGCTDLSLTAMCANDTTMDDIKDALTCSFAFNGRTRCGAGNTSIDTCTKTGLLKYEFINAPCGDGQICADVSGKAKCVTKVCTSASLACDGTRVQQCKENSYTTVVDCAAEGMTCKDGACVK